MLIFFVCILFYFKIKKILDNLKFIIRNISFKILLNRVIIFSGGFMNDCVKKQIMEQSRHHFIYGYDGREREEFLRSLEDEYPIKINENSPMAIYMNDFSLPIIEGNIQNGDDLKLSTIGREYLNFVIFSNIIDSIIKQDKLNLLENRIDWFLERISRICLVREKILSFDELVELLKESKDFYTMYYSDYLMGKDIFLNINDLKIPSLEINSVTRVVKNLLNNQSYFGIIIDKQNDIPLILMKSINSLVSRRVNSDISMKVACDPEKWDVYYGFGGVLIENIHDYGVIELDDSADKYLKKVKSKRSIF